MRERRGRGSRDPIPAWWKQEGPDDVASALADTLDHIENVSRAERRNDALHMALYGSKALVGAALGASVFGEEERDRIRFNVVQSVVDTLQAEIAQMRPKARVLTDAADWGTRKRAQLFEATIEGEFYRSDVYSLAPAAFLDACILGDGYLKVLDQYSHPVIERVYPGEILVDPIDGAYGDPQCMYQVKLVDRQTLINRFDDDAKAIEAIERAPEADRKWFPWYEQDTLLSPVLVVEAWRLPSERGADDGRHVIAVRDRVLTDPEHWQWDRQRFPFARFSWAQRQVGYRGCGLVEQLRPIQRELNHVLMKIQDCIALNAGFRVLVEGQSNVNVEHLDNIPGSILRYSGAIPPQVQTVSTVPPELFAYADRLIQRAFELSGVSMLSATSQKPAGLNSGAALREHQDIESKRFTVKAQAYEDFIGVQLAKLVIDAKRTIAERGEDEDETTVTIKRRRQRMLRRVRWDDVDLDEESYEIKVFPASSLPKTPAGRAQVLEEWFAAGLITREQMMELHEIPDIDAYVAEQLSPRDIVLDAVDRMIEDGQYVPPEPVMNLALARELVSLSYQRYRYQGVPDARLELLLRFLDDVDALEQQAQPQQPAQPTQGAQQPAPPAPPEVMN